MNISIIIIINQQDATKENIQFLNDTLRSIQQQINYIRNPDFVLNPLIIDQNLVLTPKEITYKNLLPLSVSCQALIRKEISWYSIATNQEYILVCHESKLCLLNDEMKIHREVPWLHDRICDMFFSTILNRFIIVTDQEIFNLDEKTMALTKYSIPGRNNIKSNWYCGTSHNEALFLAINSFATSIYEYKMLPSIQFVKEWQSPVSCAKDEFIYDLRSNHFFLAMIISDRKDDQTRLELRSPTTLQQQWSFHITSSSPKSRIRCCPLMYDQWLIIDPLNSRLLHIDEDGKRIKQDKYDPVPYHVVQLNKHHIVVLTKETINLHRLT
jgi:hypothetical protein